MGWPTRAARLRLFLLLCVVAVLPLSTISTSGIGATYLFIIVPLAWLLIAVAGCDLAQWLTSRLGAKRATFAGSLMTAVFVLSQVAANAQIVQFFAVTGGKGLWSDAIYALADELERLAPDHPIIALDWGFARNVNFLTRNRVQLQEAYEFLPAPSPKFQDAASVLLREPANVYVAHAAGNETFRGYRDAFERQALRMHKRLQLLAAFPERDGTPHTLVYTAADAPRTFTISPSLATRNATFDDALTLLGGQVGYDPSAREVAVRLHWQSDADRLPDDTVLVHIVDQGTGEIRLVADQQPLYGSYPFSQWQKGEVVDDPRWVSLPADVPPGVYQVRIGVYNTETGARRRIRDPQNDAAGDSLMLGTFEVK